MCLPPARRVEIIIVLYKRSPPHHPQRHSMMTVFPLFPLSVRHQHRLCVQRLDCDAGPQGRVVRGRWLVATAPSCGVALGLDYFRELTCRGGGRTCLILRYSPSPPRLLPGTRSTRGARGRSPPGRPTSRARPRPGRASRAPAGPSLSSTFTISACAAHFPLRSVCCRQWASRSCPATASAVPSPRPLAISRNCGRSTCASL